MKGWATLAAVGLSLGLAGPASAAPSPVGGWASGHCPTYGDTEVCSGEVPSFDGAPLDVDLTKPTGGGSGSHPLIVMLHGFSNDKHEWESTDNAGDGADKYRWNSHWFAQHGYYVLTYTARGFRTDQPSRDDQPNTPAGTSVSEPNGHIMLKSREFEARDTQWLAALVAQAFERSVDPNQVAVTGGSYGGGESWLLASQSRWTFPHQQASALPVLNLQVAVPKYGWTDLGYSLAPNGHPGALSGDPYYSSSTGRPDSDTGEGFPLGVPKESYITGFYTLGLTDGEFERGTRTTPNEEGPINIDTWKARVDAGDPYDPEDAMIKQIRRGLTELRGSFYQDEGWAQQAGGRKVAIFGIQGWTDELFEAIEVFRQYKYLKALDPNWPVELELADVGHPGAQNPASTWRRLNDQAWQYLQSNIGGSHDQQTTVASQPTHCLNDGDTDGNDDAAHRASSDTPEGLAAGTLTVQFSQAGAMSSKSGLADENGPGTDPVVTSQIFPRPGCRPAKGPAIGGYTAYSEPLSDPASFIGIGKVKLDYTLVGGPTATVNARLWDDPPGDGTPPLLISRGSYRIDEVAPNPDPDHGALTLPLFGNHYIFDNGHRIRLDVTQVDQPYLRPSNPETSLTFDPPRLVLPTRESGDRTVPGS